MSASYHNSPTQLTNALAASRAGTSFGTDSQRMANTIRDIARFETLWRTSSEVSRLLRGQCLLPRRSRLSKRLIV
jgi:hypothetical protein